jgi:hypothetical protein
MAKDEKTNTNYSMYMKNFVRKLDPDNVVPHK